MTPQAPQPESAAAFGSVIEHLLQKAAAFKQTYHHALSLGISPRDIVRYALCVLPPKERAQFESELVQSPWAMGRVVALVKLKRVEHDLRIRQVTVPILNHYARMEEWKDEDLEGCKLLDSIESL
jgi:hypothetical protein